MRKIIPYQVLLILILCSAGIFSSAYAQTKSLTIQHVKTLENANEFELTWLGGDYKETYYQLKGILDDAPEVLKQVFLWKVQRISAIVSDAWKIEDLENLFAGQEFQVTIKQQ